MLGNGALHPYPNVLGKIAAVTGLISFSEYATQLRNGRWLYANVHPFVAA